MIDDHWSAEKDDSLHKIWEQLEVKPDQSIENSLRIVKSKIKAEENKGNKYHLHRTVLRIAAVLLPVSLLIGGYMHFSGNIKNIEILTVNQEQKRCTLPDGTIVWLNADSKIDYPSRFNDSIRLVMLEGEAYFSVKHNKKQPFIVKTKDLSIKALGTEFNVNSYTTNSKSVATLNQGKIQVKIINEGKTTTNNGYILKPNQQLAYNKNDKSILINVVTNEVTEWKNGYLVFQDATFNDIINTLHRRYNISFRYNPADFHNDCYSIKFINHESIDQIMEILHDVVGGFSYQKSGNGILIEQDKTNN